MSQAMSLSVLVELVRHIESEHSPASGPRRKGRVVKYIDPHIDMRTNSVFSVTFRGYGWEQNFNVSNESRDLPDSLFARCMEFLDETPTSNK